MHNYKELEIWKSSLKFCTPIYKITSKFPEEEKFGLISQLRSAAVSVPSNIAEGSAKSSNKHFVIFLENALGSCREIDTQMLVSLDLEFLKNEDFSILSNELNRIMVMINNFIKKLGEN
jgi:four helix bundle protein